MTANLAMVWIVDYLPDGVVRPVIDLHKSFGITILGLAIMRVLWRTTHPAPPLPPPIPPGNVRAPIWLIGRSMS
jgi:cytochrome b561